MKILAITACTAGVAHTYMAAKKLEIIAKKRGYTIKVEKQGANGIEDRITEQDVNEADGIIIASDVGIAEPERFDGLVSVKGKVADGVRNAAQMIDALEQKVKANGGEKAHQEEKTAGEAPTTPNAFLEEEKQHPVKAFLKLWYAGAMAGVSHIIPIIIFGGLTIGILNLVFGYDYTHDPANTGVYHLYYLGINTLGLMVPIIAAYTAYGMVGKPGLAPGFVGGLVAHGGSFGTLTIVGSGFMGGLVAGAIAALSIMAIRKLKVPAQLDGVKTLILTPLFSGLITGLAMLIGPGIIFSYLNTVLTEGLLSMSGANLLILGLVLGMMSNFDFGGPINKIAYLFCIAMWTEGHWEFYAAFTAAKCIPGITLGIMAKCFPKFFDKDDQTSAVSVFILGFCGIGEGCIPYALKDPMRIIPMQMIAGGVASGLILSSGIKISTGAGGAVFMLPLIDQPFLWLTYFSIGCAIAIFGTIALKSLAHKQGKQDKDNQEQTVKNA